MATAAPPLPEGAKSTLYKTELCRTFTKHQWCPYDQKCQFAHGPAELRLPPEFPRHSGEHSSVATSHPYKDQQKAAKYKTQKCRSWAATGVCAYGDSCRYIHSEDINRLHALHSSSNPQTTAPMLLQAQNPLPAVLPLPFQLSQLGLIQLGLLSQLPQNFFLQADANNNLMWAPRMEVTSYPMLSQIPPLPSHASLLGTGFVPGLPPVPPIRADDDVLKVLCSYVDGLGIDGSAVESPQAEELYSEDYKAPATTPLLSENLGFGSVFGFGGTFPVQNNSKGMRGFGS